jgi:hypothetical protein
MKTQPISIAEKPPKFRKTFSKVWPKPKHAGADASDMHAHAYSAKFLTRLEPIFGYALAPRVRARKPADFVARAPVKRPQTPCCGKLCAGCNAVYSTDFEQSACARVELIHIFLLAARTPASPPRRPDMTGSRLTAEQLRARTRRHLGLRYHEPFSHRNKIRIAAAYRREDELERESARAAAARTRARARPQLVQDERVGRGGEAALLQRGGRARRPPAARPS